MDMDQQYDASRPVADTEQLWTIYKFYNAPTKSDPWVPRGVIQTGNDGAHALPPPTHLMPPPAFLDLGNTTSPSDCTTLPGDSGYGGSRPAFSTASVSVHGGDDLTLDSHMGQVMSECRINPDAPPADAPARLPPSGKYRCDECDAPVRSQGELKKHKQRHLKSYKCLYAGCPKFQRGFSTSNDLVRHKRSVHGEHDLPGRSFVCPHCAPVSKAPKVWPRADNFRSHLLRIHKIKLNSDDDHKEYIYQPLTRRHDLKGVGDSLEYMDSESRPMSLQESPILSEGHQQSVEPRLLDSRLVDGHQMATDTMGIDPTLFNSSPVVACQTNAMVSSSTGEETPLIHPANLSRPMGAVSDMGDSATSYMMQHQSDFAFDQPSFSHRHSFPANEDQDVEPSLSASTPRDTSSVELPLAMDSYENWNQEDDSTFRDATPEEADGFGADAMNAQHCRRVPDDGFLDMMVETPSNITSDASEIVKYLKRFPKKLLQTALRAEDVQGTEPESNSEDDSSPKVQISCPDPDCSKYFSRPCELKKHMKRHAKPYGCTFKSCSKRFGSKNDWKRHESSQHFMLEKWDCDEPDCGKICQRRESFKNHLQKDHGMSSAERIDDKLESCRLGRHCDPRFWCGFCVRVIQIDVKERGGNSWTRRCDHIDNHLFGKEGLQKQRMEEWKHQEDQMQDAGSVSGRKETEPRQKKRRNSSESSFRPRKNPRRTPTYMWICCMCSTTMNLKTSSSCFECHHARCQANCAIESVSAQENDDDGGEETQAATIPMEVDATDAPR